MLRLCRTILRSVPTASMPSSSLAPPSPVLGLPTRGGIHLFPSILFGSQESSLGCIFADVPEIIRRGRGEGGWAFQTSHPPPLMQVIQPGLIKPQLLRFTIWPHSPSHLSRRKKATWQLHRELNSGRPDLTSVPFLSYQLAVSHPAFRQTQAFHPGGLWRFNRELERGGA